MFINVQLIFTIHLAVGAVTSLRPAGSVRPQCEFGSVGTHLVVSCYWNGTIRRGFFTAECYQTGKEADINCYELVNGALQTS